MNNYNFNLSPALEALTAAINKLNSYSSSYFNNIAAAMNQVAKLQASLATNVVINNLKNTFSHIAQQISDAKNNPDSIFSWLKYERELEDMHWAWPYKISSNDILEILNQTYDEKDFDEIIAFHFTEELIEEIYNLLIKNVAKHHRVILRQAHTAFLRHDYAIANNALLSILDNSLSVYLDDAGESQRKGMFKPILEYYDNDNISDIATFIFELGMLSNNIDFIFTSISFARKEKITTNKIVRRHTALHGVKYSNKKIDTLMLFNTLINLVQLRPVLDKFKKSLKYNRNKKQFCFNNKTIEAIRKEEAEDFIISILNSSDGLTHKDLLVYLSKAHFMNDYSKPVNKYLSDMLQNMKKKKLIRCDKRNGTTFWMI